jgi:hypothetical protein
MKNTGGRRVLKGSDLQEQSGYVDGNTGRDWINEPETNP